MKAIRALVLALLLPACAGTPAPRWQSAASSSLESFRQSYFEGDTRLAQRYFAEAKANLHATGKPDLAARAELIRCALGTASLDVDACAEFEALRDSASAQDKAYGDFLAGRWQGLVAGDLPEQYRGVARAADEVAQNHAIGKIEDPVSRLVAAGALFRAGRLSPSGIETAVDTASAQGYRRPLLAYLTVQAKLAEAAGDDASLAAIRQRIDLVSRSLPAGNR